MIQSFINSFNAKRDLLRQQFLAKRPDDYEQIVRMVVEAVSDNEYDAISPERIHKIDDGDYQGTLLFVIAGRGYQPSNYWYVKVAYGSCSGCDTLEGIHGYSGAPVTETQADDYMTLALHIVQGLKKMEDE